MPCATAALVRSPSIPRTGRTWSLEPRTARTWRSFASRSARVAQQHYPVVEGFRLDEAEVDPGRRRLEQGPATAEDDRVDVDAVLVDQVVPHEGRGEVGTADHQVPAG